MYPAILFIIALVATIIHLRVRPKLATRSRFVETLLSYVIPLNIGVGCLLLFIAQTVYGPGMAYVLGWISSPFQIELAAANLALSIAGFISIWWRGYFWLATLLISAITVLGATYAHMTYSVAYGNHGIFNFINGIFVPAAFLVLGYLYGMYNHLFKVDHKKK